MIFMKVAYLLVPLLLLSTIASSASPLVDWYRATSYYFKEEPSNEADLRLTLTEGFVYAFGFSDGLGAAPHSLSLCYSREGTLEWSRVKTVGSAKLVPPLPIRGGISSAGGRVYVVQYLNRLTEVAEYSIRIIRLGGEDGNDLDGSMWLLGLEEDWEWPIYPDDLEVIEDDGGTAIYVVGTYLEFGKIPRGFIAKLRDNGESLELSWFLTLYRKLFTRSRFLSIELDDSGLYVSGSFLRETDEYESGLMMKLSEDGRTEWVARISSERGNVTIYDSRLKGDEISCVGELKVKGDPTTALYVDLSPEEGGKAVALERASFRAIGGNPGCEPDVIAGYVYDEGVRRNSAYVGMYDGEGMEPLWNAAWGSEEADFFASDLVVDGAVYIVGGDANVTATPKPKLEELDVKPVDGKVSISFLPSYQLEEVKATLEKVSPLSDPEVALKEEFSPKSRDGYLLRLAVPTNLTVKVSPPGSGGTSPGVGTHVYPIGSEVSVSATPREGWELDHWELDGADAGSSPSIQVKQCINHTLVAHFREAPGGEESEEEVSEVSKNIRSPSMCELSFSQFPERFRFLARKADRDFNRDVLLSMFQGFQMPGQRAKIVILGGPEKISYDWRSVGVEFLRERGSYSAMRFSGSGSTYRAVFGEEDYAVVYRECDSGVIRIAGITRYGTRAGLLWVLNNLDALVSGPKLRFLEWTDINGNGSVEPWEVLVKA